MRFFFDNNLPARLAKALQVLAAPEHDVIHLKEKFAPDTPDEVWMSGLAKELDWVIISGDVRIGKNPHQVRAWRAAGHTIFFLKPGWTNYDFWTQAYKFVKCFPDILAAAAKARSGDSFFVGGNGKITWQTAVSESRCTRLVIILTAADRLRKSAEIAPSAVVLLAVAITLSILPTWHETGSRRSLSPHP